MTQLEALRPPDLPGDVWLRFCNLDDDRDIALSEARDALSSKETARADRFRFERDAYRYIRGRGFVRQQLGRALSCAAKDVPLIEAPKGKPALAGPGPGFNLSHSAGLAVLALRQNGPIGVDLELDRGLDPLKIAPACFQAHEIAALEAQKEALSQRALFLTYWTAKEALMKLTGEGMALDPKAISLRLQGTHPTGFDAPAPHRTVHLCQPDLGPGRTMALAWNTAQDT
ncbi:MAG: 4'-phosphopantetheinyl transferase superfamily protein [Pseudomonadota bacterium]